MGDGDKICFWEDRKVIFFQQDIKGYIGYVLRRIILLAGCIHLNIRSSSLEET